MIFENNENLINMARLKKSTARPLAVLAAIAIIVCFLLYGYLVGWEYLLGIFPILTIMVIIVGAVLWILGLGDEKQSKD